MNRLNDITKDIERLQKATAVLFAMLVLAFAIGTATAIGMFVYFQKNSPKMELRAELHTF